MSPIDGNDPRSKRVGTRKQRPWRVRVGPMLAALVGLAVLAAVGGRWWLGPQAAIELVLRADFVQTVVATGHIEAPHRIDVAAQITGTVLHVPVSEGQTVESGDLLVELDAAELRAVGRQADAAEGQARARLRQLQEVQAPVAAQTLRQAQANLDNAVAEWGRSQSLFSRGFIAQAALDNAGKTRDLADAQVRAARKQWEATRSDGSDRALAAAEVDGARASAQAARIRAGYARIVASVGGTLIARNVEVGDVVQPGKVLMTLSPRGRAQLVVQIDEKNLGLLSLGQTARVSADAYPNERFSAQLAYINPGVDVSTGAVEVKLDVAAPPSVLLQDMTVSVDIEVARRDQALIVPQSALRDLDTAPWVLRLEGRRAVRRSVELGLRSGNRAVVLAGLAEGDAVLVDAAAIQSGVRVRATSRPPDPVRERP